jgi:hypothetical protein
MTQTRQTKPNKLRWRKRLAVQPGYAHTAKRNIGERASTVSPVNAMLTYAQTIEKGRKLMNEGGRGPMR